MRKDGGTSSRYCDEVLFIVFCLFDIEFKKKVLDLFAFFLLVDFFIFRCL